MANVPKRIDPLHEDHTTMNPHAPKTSHTAAVSLASALVVLTLILFLALPYPAYTWIKWILSLGLFLTAGFYLQPRRRALVQPPEQAGQSVDLKGASSFTAKAARNAGFVEIDRVTKTVVNPRNGSAAQFQYPDFEFPHDGHNLTSEGDFFRPVSLNIGTIHLLAGVFFNPLAGIGMSRGNWLYADALLLIYLLFALAVIVKEQSDPRKSVIFLDDQGRPRYHPEPTEALKHSATQVWPILAALSLLGCAFVLNASGILRYEGFLLPRLGISAAVMVVVSATLTGFVIWISGLIWNSREVKSWTLAAVFLSLFLATASSDMVRKSAGRDTGGGYSDDY